MSVTRDHGNWCRGDTWFLKDAGADPVVDFTDAGFGLDLSGARLRRSNAVFVTLLAHLPSPEWTHIVSEVADAFCRVKRRPCFALTSFEQPSVESCFAACDAMGAVGGDRWLKSHELTVVGLSGVLTSSPLQCVESLERHCCRLLAKRSRARQDRHENLDCLPGGTQAESPHPRAPRTADPLRTPECRTHASNRDTGKGKILYRTLRGDRSRIFPLRAASVRPAPRVRRGAWDFAQCAGASRKVQPLLRGLGVILVAPHFPAARFSDYHLSEESDTA